MAAIRSINTLATPDGTAILVLQNFHRFLLSAEVVQALARQIVSGKQNRTIVIVLSPVVQIPTELEKMFVVMEHDLPNRQELDEIARGIATEDGELPEDSDLQTVIDAAAGLTRMEAENAFSLSLVGQSEGRTHPFLADTWKAMPADLSVPRLGSHVLNLLEDMPTWSDPKFVLGEVDVFKIEPGHELYGHMNVNYLRLDRPAILPLHDSS